MLFLKETSKDTVTGFSYSTVYDCYHEHLFLLELQHKMSLLLSRSTAPVLVVILALALSFWTMKGEGDDGRPRLNSDSSTAEKLAVATLLALFLEVLFVVPRFVIRLGCWMGTLLVRLQRSIEGVVGGALLQLATNRLIQKAGLIKKTQIIPSKLCGGSVVMHYYERPSSITDKETGEASSSPPPTLLLCHGMGSESKNLVALMIELAKELPSEWRMIAPDVYGHGHDLDRVMDHYRRHEAFPYPAPEDLGDGVKDLLDALGITRNCYAYGASMGGCLVYHLQQRYPQLIVKSILISPALEVVVDDRFLESFRTGQKNHFCWESRADVEEFMIDLSCPQRQKNPIPRFLLEAIWQDRQTRAPPGHFRTLLDKMLRHRGEDPQRLGCAQDIDPTAQRLVLWPEDDYISNHGRGQRFFAESLKHNTVFRSIPDCGHLFHADGKTVLIHAAPMMVEYLLAQES